MGCDVPFTECSWAKWLCLCMAASALWACTEVPANESAARTSPLQGPTQDVMVYLREQPELGSFASSLRSIAAISVDAVQHRSDLYRRLVAHAQDTQPAVLSLLAGTEHQAFHIMNAISVRHAGSDLIAQLRTHPDVARVVADQPVSLQREPTAQSYEFAAESIEPSLVATGADRVWSRLGIRGGGVVVAGQDTGVDWTHPALKSKYRGVTGEAIDHRYSWHDAIHEAITGEGDESGTAPANRCGYDLKEPCDDDAHGTHTMGTVVGDDGAGNQIGMAPDATWIACRNMDTGVGRPSTYIECLEWFLAPYPQGGDPRTDGDPSKSPDVVNNSWGCTDSEGCTGRELIPALHALAAAGVIQVVSAGNEGPACGSISTQPATDTPDVLTVGAYDYRNDQLASFSSRGPSTLDSAVGPVVAAPGVGIRSSVPGGAFAGGWSGTSMAGPHVTGEVALILSAAPGLKGQLEDVKKVVSGTAKPKTSTQDCGGGGASVPNNAWGYGIIDAYAAVRSVL
jgi:serine protease AprX